MRGISTHYPFHEDFNTSKDKGFSQRLSEQGSPTCPSEPIEYTGEGSKTSYDRVKNKVVIDTSFLV